MRRTDAMGSEPAGQRRAAQPMGQEGFERLIEQAKQLARYATFEGRVEQLERICLATPGIMPHRDPYARPAKRSRARYAEDILRAIRTVRHHLDRGEAEHAASKAVLVGVLAAQAEVDFDWPELKAWRAVREGQERARAKSVEKQRELLDAVRELRAANPGRYESALAAATHLIDSAPWGTEPWGYDVDRADPATRERAIDNLRKRIRRAEKAAHK